MGSAQRDAPAPAQSGSANESGREGKERKNDETKKDGRCRTQLSVRKKGCRSKADAYELVETSTGAIYLLKPPSPGPNQEFYPM
ncbi:hypothetical protein Q3G72_031849 [Acer saccharum]|nr:hypothetical protein Q3G72_031849 [Acer saccharum]